MKGSSYDKLHSIHTRGSYITIINDRKPEENDGDRNDGKTDDEENDVESDDHNDAKFDVTTDQTTQINKVTQATQTIKNNQPQSSNKNDLIIFADRLKRFLENMEDQNELIECINQNIRKANQRTNAIKHIKRDLL